MSGDRNSSRVLKPPGGGHTNIFGESEVKVNSPRPKYDQQNSSNLNFCMNTPDPNLLVEQVKHEIVNQTQSAKPADSAKPPPMANDNANFSSIANATNGDGQAQVRANRVPPGGFSSGGFW